GGGARPGRGSGPPPRGAARFLAARSGPVPGGRGRGVAAAIFRPVLRGAGGVRGRQVARVVSRAAGGSGAGLWLWRAPVVRVGPGRRPSGGPRRRNRACVTARGCSFGAPGNLGSR